MRFCVIGAGAMGGVYGLSLIEAGYKVNFLDVNRDHVNAVKENSFFHTASSASSSSNNGLGESNSDLS